MHTWRREQAWATDDPVLTLGHDLATLGQVHVRLPQIDTLGRDDHL